MVRARDEASRETMKLNIGSDDVALPEHPNLTARLKFLLHGHKGKQLWTSTIPRC
jgi:hypothetical protein